MHVKVSTTYTVSPCEDHYNDSRQQMGNAQRLDVPREMLKIKNFVDFIAYKTSLNKLMVFGFYSWKLMYHPFTLTVYCNSRQYFCCHNVKATDTDRVSPYICGHIATQFPDADHALGQMFPAN